MEIARRRAECFGGAAEFECSEAAREIETSRTMGGVTDLSNV